MAEKINKVALIRGEVQSVKSVIVSDVNVAKEELDKVIKKLNALEGDWNPLTLTAAKDYLQGAQTSISAIAIQFEGLQRRISAILRSA